MPEGKHVTLQGSDLPEQRDPIDAHACFFDEYLGSIEKALSEDWIESLTIVLGPASSDHDAWRRAVAGDLARKHTPKRFNIAAGRKGEALERVLDYLRDASGVTGHYLQSHD